ncbi:hypothetical protein [Nocardia carnea]|uniref:hypothetical protein n=1 Tax=Nocardia carnea TaxID=37328 RepID=UPI0024540563|nr:hypothetical protein [Nocardia carnea]
MDLDRISTRTAELAANFGVRAPRIVAGNVPTWSTLGLRYATWKRPPVLRVGARFGDLLAAEQEGALALALVAGDFYRAGAYKTVIAFGLSFSAVGLPLVYLAVLSGLPGSVVLPVFAALYVLSYLLTFAVRSRRIIYRIDHRVAEVMGRPVMDLMIDHDIRNYHLVRGFMRIYSSAFSPTVAQRVRRLDTAFGPRVLAA